MKSIIAGLLLFAGLQCALSGRAAAQVGSICVGKYGNINNPGPNPPWMFGCQTTGPWLVVCNGMTVFCAPVAGPAETCASCAAAAASSPISLASGNTFIVETDVKVPGLSGGLKLVRTWNSMWPITQSAYQIGLFGPNWRSNYEERIFLGNDNYMKYARGDGSFWSFGVNSTGTSLGVAAPANQNATLSQGSSYWTLTFQNGEQRLFDNTSGNLISIIDRNGNTTQLTYDSVDRLVTVTDPASRHLYFSYANGSSLLVTAVTSDVGLSLSYAYDGQGRLIQVTNPDLSTLSFAYDSNSFITSVTDSQGKVLESHTYDSSGHGLTGSRANGVDAVTISYTN
jgi:YD repeat-containing protein